MPIDPETADPQLEIKILDCGLNSLTRKYDLTAAQLDAVTDLR